MNHTLSGIRTVSFCAHKDGMYLMDFFYNFMTIISVLIYLMKLTLRILKTWMTLMRSSFYDLYLDWEMDNLECS